MLNTWTYIKVHSVSYEANAGLWTLCVPISALRAQLNNTNADHAFAKGHYPFIVSHIPLIPVKRLKKKFAINCKLNISTL